MQTELVEGGAEMNQALLVGGHAGFNQCVNAVIVGLPRFVDERVLQEVLLKAGVGGSEGHRRRAVAVVDDVEVGQKETGCIPGAPLVVAVHRANAHVHGGAVGQGEARWKIIGAGCTGGGEARPQGREMPSLVGRRPPVVVVAELDLNIGARVRVVGEGGRGDGLKQEICLHPRHTVIHREVRVHRGPCGRAAARGDIEDELRAVGNRGVF